jgi:hypothetical protein
VNDNVARWNEYLAGLEKEIAEAHAHLEVGAIYEGALLQPWAPSPNLPPLPLELLERAQRASKALNDLELRTELAKAHFKDEIARISALKTKLPAQKRQYGENTIARYVDRHA